MREEEITITAPDGIRLSGTLTLPDAAPLSLLVMIHGTGPLDRDENLSGAGPGQRLNVFNALAHDLAASGHASFRYDKRGCGRSGGDYLTHGQDDLLGDAAACIAELVARFGSVPVLLLGHSEGTIIAPRVAEMRREVAGLVLVCPFLRQLEDILMWQAHGLSEAQLGQRGLGATFVRIVTAALGGVEAVQARLISRLRASRAPVIRVLGRRVTARSLRDLLDLDVRAIHAGNRLPTLLLVAEKDVQCPPEDGAAIAALNPLAQVVVVEDLTHILRKSAALPGFGDYSRQLQGPIDPDVARTILEWLDARYA